MARFATFLMTWLALICCCNEAKAQLDLVLDTANDTLYFFGTDSGISAGIDEFVISGPNPVIAFPNTIDISAAIDGATGNLSISTDPAVGPFVVLDLFSDSGPNEPAIYTGIGVDGALSYGSFSEDEKLFLESQIGNSLEFFGTEFENPEFENISVVTAVPEPTSAVVLSSALAVLASRRKRS